LGGVGPCAPVCTARAVWRGKMESENLIDPIVKKQGQRYWCVKTSLAADGLIYLVADEARVLPDGTLMLIHNRDSGSPVTNLAIAPGNWSACYAARVDDETPIAVQRWGGVVDRGPSCLKPEPAPGQV
jgi:hypothetical protein